MIPRRKSVPLILGLIGSIMISTALGAETPERIMSGNTKIFYGNAPYDKNYMDDGYNHLRGPTASSSASTVSVINPYQTAASNSHSHAKEGSKSGGDSIISIVDHYYGPNGEEKVQYTNPSQMDKEELDQILSQIGTTKLSSQPQHGPPPYPHKPNIYVHPPAPQSSPSSSHKHSTKPHTTTLYKSSSTPSASTQPGFSLPSLYKATSENHSPKPAASYRPAYSTIYKDPLYSQQKSHYSKPSHPEYSSHSSPYSHHGGSPPHPPKEPILLSSPPEPSYHKGSSYYGSDSPPKSINDALLGDPYPRGPPPYPRGIPNGIEHDDSPPHYAMSYPPPPPSHYHHHHHHSPPPPPHHEYSPSVVGPSKEEYGYGKGHHSLKAGFHSLPVKSQNSPSHGSSYDYGSMPPPPPLHGHHESYSSGFGGGYSGEEPIDPYSHPSSKGYPKSPYSSSTPSSGGHSLSSLYAESGPSSPYSSKSPPPKPTGFGGPPPPFDYSMSYGPPVEYHMPPKGGASYSTSASPYGSSSPYSTPGKYKGAYRIASTGPSGYPSYGYGFGKPHGLLHGSGYHYPLQRSSTSTSSSHNLNHNLNSSSDSHDTRKSPGSGGVSSSPGYSQYASRTPPKYQGDYHHVLSSY